MSAPRKAEEPQRAVVPRGWLVTLAGLFLAPWLVVALFVTRVPGGAPTPGAGGPGGESASVQTAVGPWGELTVSPIVISPPLEYVSADDDRVAPIEWRFPAVALGEVEAFLTSAGLRPDHLARIRGSLRAEPRINGVVAVPDAALVRDLDPGVRARLYTMLARSPLNANQAHSYRFKGDSPGDWLDGSAISLDTRRIVEPLIYRDGGFLHFADFSAIQAAIADPLERRRLAKTLLRQPTILVRLSIDDESDVRDLAEYWGRGGRRTDLLPLLESGALPHPGGSIDIVHLLPMFARNHLYRYPRITAADLDRPVIANCLWTVLNFFADEPDDRFLDVATALGSLKRDYYVIGEPSQLGDVIAFLDADGDLYHAAVFLADDLVFTKNGTTPMAPWMIMSIDDVKGYYRSHAPETRMIVHRRTGM